MRLFLVLVNLALMVEAVRKIQYLSSTHENQSALKMRAADWLMYSWAPDDSGDSPNMLKSKMKLFSLGDSEIDYGVRPYADYQWVMSDSLCASASKIAAAIGVSGSYGPAFSGAVSASTNRESSSHNRKFRSDLFIFAKKYHASSHAVYPEKFLLPDARHFLLTKSPAEIISKFGAFYASQIEFGGVVRTTLTKTASESESTSSFQSEAEAKASYMMAQASAKSSLSTTSGRRDTNQEVSLKISTQGGDSHIWLQMSGDAKMAEIQERWARSVSEHNVAPIRFTLAPLWDVLKALDWHKGYALEVELKKRWESQTSNLRKQDAFPSRKPGQIDDVVNFVSLNYPDHRLRHYNYEVWLSKAEQTDTFRKDSAFRIKRGLADSNAVSFESVNYPGHYIRHYGWFCYINRISTWQEKQDATFHNNWGWEAGERGFRSFESYNLKGAHLRHYGYYLKLSHYEGSAYKRDASWKMIFADLP